METINENKSKTKTMSESSLWLLLDAYRARRQGPQAMAQRQRARLADMVAYARANSPYYREHYQRLPEHRRHVNIGQADLIQ